jgi:hypothetical protein
MSFLYSPKDLYEWAEEYGMEGRRVYIRARFTFDLVWPVVYMIFLSTAISWISRKAFQSGSGWQRMNLVPVLGAIFDYLENISTSIVMGRYPRQTIGVDVLAPTFTFVKWIFVGGSFLLLLMGTAAGIWRWIKKRGR